MCLKFKAIAIKKKVHLSFVVYIENSNFINDCCAISRAFKDKKLHHSISKRLYGFESFKRKWDHRLISYVLVFNTGLLNVTGKITRLHFLGIIIKGLTVLILLVLKKPFKHLKQPAYIRYPPAKGYSKQISCLSLYLSSQSNIIFPFNFQKKRASKNEKSDTRDHLNLRNIS